VDDKYLKNLFQKYQTDNSVRLLNQAYLKLEGITLKAGKTQDDIEVLKVKIVNNTIKRVGFINRRKNLTALIYGSIVALLMGTGFSFYQSLTFSKEIVLAKTELFQILGDNLEEQYQKSFDSLQTVMEKQLDDNFKKLNTDLTVKLNKESVRLRKIASESQAKSIINTVPVDSFNKKN
jgi:hypothetical protein